MLHYYSVTLTSRQQKPDYLDWVKGSIKLEVSFEVSFCEAAGSGTGVTVPFVVFKGGSVTFVVELFGTGSVSLVSVELVTTSGSVVFSSGGGGVGGSGGGGSTISTQTPLTFS